MAEPMFKLGCQVQYISASHGGWMDTIVDDVRADGYLQIACKPGYYFPIAEQEQKLRVAPLATPKSGGYNSQASVASGPWSTERAIGLAARTSVGLGARRPDEITWANKLDGVQSVHVAVEQLNSGALSCTEGCCIVYSASSSCHYVLYRDPLPERVDTGNDSRLTELEARLEEETKKVSRLNELEARLEEETKKVVELTSQRSALEADLVVEKAKQRSSVSTAAEVSPGHAADQFERIRNLDKALDAERDLRARLQDDLSMKDALLAASEQDVQKAEAEAAKKYEDRIDTLEASIDVERQKAMQMVESAVDSATRAASGSKDTLTAKNAALERELVEMKLKLERAASAAASAVATSALAPADTAGGTTDERISSLQKSVSALQTTVKDEKALRRESEGREEKLLEANDTLIAARRSLEQQLKDLKAK